MQEYELKHGLPQTNFDSFINLTDPTYKVASAPTSLTSQHAYASASTTAGEDNYTDTQDVFEFDVFSEIKEETKKEK